MNSTIFCLRPVYHVFCDGRGELVSCMTVDIQAARSAPIGKRFGIDHGANDDLPLSAKLLLASLGFHPPFAVRSGELLAVGHDPKDGVVIFESIPDHADMLNAEGVYA